MGARRESGASRRDEKGISYQLNETISYQRNETGISFLRFLCGGNVIVT